MLAPKSFYITLPSNVKSHGHQKNLTSEYTTLLPKPLQLSRDNWEISLVEIAYPYSWNNITEPYNTIKFRYYQPKNDTYVSVIQKVEESYYKSLEDLVAAINTIKPEGFRGNLAFEKKGRKIKIVLFQKEEIKFHDRLAQLLGFTENTFNYSSPEMTEDEPDRIRIKATFHGDIRALHYNIYVYSNIIEPRLVGTRYLPLLRTINVDASEGSYVSKVYTYPQFLNLSSDYIESIEIKITDDTGENLAFTWGKVIVTLLFRQKSFLHYR